MTDSVTASRGAALLDDRVPGWADMIDLRTFDLESVCDCVLGQVQASLHPRARTPYRRYDRGLAELGLSYDEARRFGFAARDDGLVGRTWRKLIRARQS